jgi:hypothetical protein
MEKELESSRRWRVKEKNTFFSLRFEGCENDCSISLRISQCLVPFLIHWSNLEEGKKEQQLLLSNPYPVV